MLVVAPLGGMLTVKQVASELGLTSRIVLKLIKNKDIVAHKVGRNWIFFRADIDGRLTGRDSLQVEKENDLDQTAKENAQQVVIELSVEFWRFSKLFAKAIGRLDEVAAARYANQARYFQRKLDDILEKSGIKLVSIEGEEFEPGVAATALNIDDFDQSDILIVDQMIDPIVMGPNGLKKQGTLMLRKAT